MQFENSLFNTLKKFIIGLIIFVIPNQAFSQSFFIKFISDTVKQNHICTMYVSGYNNQDVRTSSVSIPFNGYIQFRCDSAASLYLTIDCIPEGFVVNKRFNCGDSATINIDKRTVNFINRRE